MAEGVNDASCLIRLPSVTLDAVDETLKKRNTNMKRSEFIRRAIRFTLENFEQFKKSESYIIREDVPPDMLEKEVAINALWVEIQKYSDTIMADHLTHLNEKRIAYLVRKMGEMIYKMST